MLTVVSGLIPFPSSKQVKVDLEWDHSRTVFLRKDDENEWKLDVGSSSRSSAEWHPHRHQVDDESQLDSQVFWTNSQVDDESQLDSQVFLNLFHCNEFTSSYLCLICILFQSIATSLIERGINTRRVTGMINQCNYEVSLFLQWIIKRGTMFFSKRKRFARNH